MNALWRTVRWSGLALLTATAFAARAADEEPRMPRSDDDNRDRVDGPRRPGPPGRLTPGGGDRRVAPPVRAGEDGVDGAVFRWLERIRESHPEEFARMRRLRETNPEQFREEMRRRMQRRIGGDKEDGGERPAVEGDARRGPRPPPRIERDPENEQLERELVRLAREFHAATPPADREVLREKIRGTLREAFERRDATWTERIEAMRRDLAQFEERVARWRKTRDAVIEERLRAILETDPAAAPPAE